MMKKLDKKDLGLFAEENIQESFLDESTDDSKLDVIKFKAMQLDNAGKWQDLFTGYTELKAITFSSSLGMIKHLCRMFSRMEIILGNERVAGSKLDLLQEQYGLVSTLKFENKKSGNIISDKMARGDFSIFVTKLDGKTSHQKVFLLRNPEKGEYRVITGSANLSFTAFAGEQMEIINVADDYDSYTIYDDIYEKTKEFSTQEVTVENVVALDLEHIDQLPVFSEVEERKVVKIVEPSNADDTTITYITQKDSFKNALKEAGIKEEDLVEKHGKSRLLTVDSFRSLKQKISFASDKIKRQYVNFPAFEYNPDEGILLLNGEPMDLETNSREDVGRDIDLLIKFFDGYFATDVPFTGNVALSVEKYFATIVYSFAAPFISVCRYYYAKTAGEPFAFPMFLLLRGISNAGKTQLLRFILRLMFNPYHINISNSQGVFQSATSEENSPNALLNRTAQAKGFPIMLDELNKLRWKDYADKVVKRDIVNLVNVSPVIMASNEVSPLSEALIKRTIVFDVNMSVPRRGNRLVRSNIRDTKKITGALYREYLHRMLQQMPEFLNRFNNNDRFAPDLFALSSMTLVEIFKEHLEEKKIPDYVHNYDLDYYTDRVNIEENRVKLLKMYLNEGDTWDVNRKQNKVVINFDASYKADYFQREYKEECGIEYFGGMSVTLDLEKTEKFLGKKLKGKSFWDRVW